MEKYGFCSRSVGFRSAQYSILLMEFCYAQQPTPNPESHEMINLKFKIIYHPQRLLVHFFALEQVGEQNLSEAFVDVSINKINLILAAA